MKLKKIVAVAAAAVLSLAMLTACGGGGGSSVPADGWTRKLITVEKNGQEVAEADAQVNYFTSNGKWTYSKTTYKGTDHEYLSGPDNVSYRVNTSGETWKAYKETAEDIEAGTTTKVENSGEYKGKIYRTVTYTTVYSDETVISTYYYDGTNLKYIKNTSQQPGYDDYTTVKKVLVDKSGVDPENEKKLDINNYNLVTDDKDLK